MKPTCTICNSPWHYQTFCRQKKNSLIRKYGKAELKHRETKMRWIQANPPVNGKWRCALHIAPLCPFTLDIDQLTVDHIKPKGSHPELAHELSNLQPACIYCNGLKGSRQL